MGGGASSKQQEGRKRGGSPKSKSIVADDQLLDDVDPSKYVPPGQEIIHSGHVLKLNMGADPEDMGEWRCRKMWLTNFGGLFYYSLQHSKPFGRNVAGLRVTMSEGNKLGLFIFEVLPPAEAGDGEAAGSSGGAATMLATRSASERDAWVGHLGSLEVGILDNDELDPLEPLLGGGLHQTRRRLSLQSDTAPPMRQRLSTASMVTDVARTFSSSSTGPSIFSEVYLTINTRRRASLVSQCSGAPAGEGGLSPRESRGRVRRDSQASFAEKASTMLVLDWDDTLFPTTWVREDCGLHWKYPLAEQVQESPGRTTVEKLLETLAGKVDAFLATAADLANIVIVTLARQPWVSTSAVNFMPHLTTLLQKHELKVVYARDCIPQSLKAEYAQEEFKSGEQEADYWMRVKAAAMETEIKDFYSASSASWKNCVSLGDSEFERAALVKTTSDYMAQESEDGEVVSTGITAEAVSKDGHLKRLRTKTVKMLDEPSVEELIAQITVLTSWLPFICAQDEGLDVELVSSEDDIELNDLNKSITGRDENLSWLRLAGVAEE